MSLTGYRWNRRKDLKELVATCCFSMKKSNKTKISQCIFRWNSSRSIGTKHTVTTADIRTLYWKHISKLFSELAQDPTTEEHSCEDRIAASSCRQVKSKSKIQTATLEMHHRQTQPPAHQTMAKQRPLRKEVQHWEEDAGNWSAAFKIRTHIGGRHHKQTKSRKTLDR